MLSICIPVYNYELTNLVNELYAQCTKANIDFEIIALDDASSRQDITSKNKTINLSNFKYKIGKINRGNITVRNYLIRESNFEWVLFLDADVKPVSGNFIKNYLRHINNPNFDVISGGITYEDTSKKNKSLRWTYGMKKEVFNENSTPFLNIYGGNFLVRKEVYLPELFIKMPKKYGFEEAVFGIQLYKMGKKIKLIKNPVYHLGLDSSDVFLEKSKQSIENAFYLINHYPEIAKEIKLVKAFYLIRMLKLITVVTLLFEYFEPIMKQNILSANPKIFIFQTYKLCFLCSLSTAS